MKRTILTSLLLITFVISGCQLPTFIGKQSDPIKRPVTVEENTTTENTTTEKDITTEENPEEDSAIVSPMEGIAPYFKNGSVEFYPEVKTIELGTIITPTLQEEIMRSYQWDPAWGNAPSWAQVSEYFRFYEAGTFTATPFENQTLVILALQCEGMCFGPSIYRFAYNKTQNKLTFLMNHSSEDRSSMVTPLLKDLSTITLKGLTLPSKIKLPNSDKYGEIQMRDNVYFPTQSKEYGFTFGPILFTDKELGNAYSQASGESTEYPSCFYMRSPDGSASLYGYDPGLIDINSAKNIKAWIKWNDGNMDSTLGGDDYAYMAGGCGMTGICYMIENVKEEDLVIVGKTTTGIDIYVAKNPTSASAAATKLSSLYETYNASIEYDTSKQSMDYQTFIAMKPVLYWKDPFGRFAGLVNRSVQPPAECGKPVIYLYPEKEIDVSVKVLIDEFTKTVPEYGKGWTVHAYPDGKIYNYADKQFYPYLFWEGHKNGNLNPAKGTVVKKEEAKKFISESLTKLGLNKVEKDEFISFWVPKIEANTEEYVFISFVGTKDFNKVAPLEIIPAPQTLLRVFMYYEPVNSLFKTIPQEFKGMERKGFTVVEWGGTSSRPWQE